MRKLYIIATILGLLACLCAVTGPGFAKGVKQSDTCTVNNPDHWMCSLFGESDE